MSFRIPPAHEPLSLGVVGFGKLGLLHAAIANSLPGCRLAAVVENQSLMLSFLKSQMPGVAIYKEHNDLLKMNQLHGVFIATPTHLHIPAALDFVRAGIPVFIEKPLSITTTQAKPLLQAIAQNPLPNMVGYMSRFNETFQKAHKLVRSGILGRLQMLHGTMYIGQVFRAGKGWRFDKSVSGGGVLITQNSHLVDMLRWIFGEIESVSGISKQLYSFEVEDAVHAFLTFDNGLTGWIDTSWSSRHHRLLTMNLQVQASDGTLEVNDDEVKLFLDHAKENLPAGWSIWKKPDLFKGVVMDIAYPYYTRQAEQFVAAIRGQNQIESDIASAYRTQAVIDSIYDSARQGGVPVPVRAEP